LDEAVIVFGQASLKNWPTPDTNNHRDGTILRKDNNLEQGGFHGVSLHHAMSMYGQPVPDNPNTHGNRPESWATPSASNPNEGETLESWNARQIKNKEKHKNGNGAGTPLAIQIKQWATPRAGKTTDENPETWALRQAKGDVATMPLGAQVQAWATPSNSMTAGRSEQMNCRAGREGYGHVGNHLLRQTGNNGKLNPRWVCVLMNLPVFWVKP
jgi:hypothetical protein